MCLSQKTSTHFWPGGLTKLLEIYGNPILRSTFSTIGINVDPFWTPAAYWAQMAASFPGDMLVMHELPRTIPRITCCENMISVIYLYVFCEYVFEHYLPHWWIVSRQEADLSPQWLHTLILLTSIQCYCRCPDDAMTNCPIATLLRVDQFSRSVPRETQGSKQQ